MRVTRKALVDAQGNLLAHGFCEFEPADGQSVIDAPTDFSYDTYKARWDGTEWRAITPVPSITRRQCRLWLLKNGLRSKDVVGAINAITDPDEQERAHIEWEDAGVFHHTHPLIALLAAYIGIDPDTLPDAFRDAAKL